MSDISEWQSFKQYELEQRKERAAREQRLAEQQAHEKKVAEAEQALREWYRRESEQQQATQQQQAKQQASEQQRLREEAHRAEVKRQAETLRLADQKRYVALLEARERAKQRIVHEKRVWVGQDGYVYRSPAELEFYEEWIRDATRAETIPLERQYHLGRYYADFADPVSKTAIEIDGWGYHGKNQSDFEYGYERAQDIEEQGWDIRRVTAKQIYNDVQIHVMRVHRHILRRRGMAR